MYNRRNAARSVHYFTKQDFQIHEEKTSSRRCHAAAGCRCRNRIRRLRLSEHSELMNANVEALTRHEINPDCPNGCQADGRGCHCYEDYPDLKEAEW